MRRSLAAALIASALSVAGSARAEVVDRVVGVVGDRAIFLSERRRFVGASRPATRAELEARYRAALETHIDFTLGELAAERAGVVVEDAEVDRAIRNVRRQARLDEETFWPAVCAPGFTRRAHREDVRRQLRRLKWMDRLGARPLGTITVSNGASTHVYSRGRGSGRRVDALRSSTRIERRL